MADIGNQNLYLLVDKDALLGGLDKVHEHPISQNIEADVIMVGLQQAIHAAKKSFTNFAAQSDAEETLQIAFVSNYHRDRLHRHLQLWETGDFLFMPTIEVHSTLEINGADNDSRFSSFNFIMISPSIPK